LRNKNDHYRSRIPGYHATRDQLTRAYRVLKVAIRAMFRYKKP